MLNAQVTAHRVLSQDGTEIAYWASGGGPPLLLVHGTTADHTRWSPILPFLEPHVTVYAMDRRGRGGSSDAPDYEIEREFDDVATVVDVIAESSGSAVDVLGHSFGGQCAYGAASRTANIRRMVLYEGWPHPELEPEAFLSSAVTRRMDALISAGQREDALEIMFREVVQMPEQEFAVYRTLPAWPSRVAAAHTIGREVHADARRLLNPSQAASITVPTMLLVGGDSADVLTSGVKTLASALPSARVTVLQGQRHVAMDFVPEQFAGEVLTFLRG